MKIPTSRQVLSSGRKPNRFAHCHSRSKRHESNRVFLRHERLEGGSFSAPWGVQPLLSCTRGRFQRMLSPRMTKTPTVAAIIMALVFLGEGSAHAQESLDALQKRAATGNAEAQTALGTKYRNGDGVH